MAVLYAGNREQEGKEIVTYKQTLKCTKIQKDLCIGKKKKRKKYILRGKIHSKCYQDGKKKC